MTDSNCRTEREKMLAGELYLASDSELLAATQRALILSRRYNTLPPDDTDALQRVLRELLGGLGDNAKIVPPFHCDYGSQIFIGDNFYMNYGGVILDCNTVHIGDNVLCGPYVQIYTAYHPTDPQVRLSGRELAATITIGNNVWLGGSVIVCPGVTIGDNTTIGAGSVVTKDIPANAIAVGNPCRVIRSVEAPPSP